MTHSSPFPLPRNAAPITAALSSGFFPGDEVGSGPGILSGRRIDLQAVRRMFPSRWSAFLRAHFRSSTEVAFFFDVNEKTARLWLEGATAPRAEVVLALIERAPSVLPALLADAA